MNATQTRDGLMHSFRFTDHQWREITVELSALKQPDGYDARLNLEVICSRFISLRPMLGHHRFSPATARHAWLRVAEAADELHAAIKDLLSTRIHSSFPGAGGSALPHWVAQLPTIVEAAEAAAAFEMSCPALLWDGPNTDPLLQGFVNEILYVWDLFGGTLSTSYDPENDTAIGPLIRFLAAVTAPPLDVLGEPSLTPNKIRSMVRKTRILGTDGNRPLYDMPSLRSLYLMAS